jgi:hypothetical protein
MSDKIGGMSMAELEFVAQEQTVLIIPSFQNPSSFPLLVFWLILISILLSLTLILF